MTTRPSSSNSPRSFAAPAWLDAGGTDVAPLRHAAAMTTHALELFPDADHRIALVEQATGREQVEWSPTRRFVPGYLETMTDWLHHSVFHPSMR